MVGYDHEKENQTWDEANTGWDCEETETGTSMTLLGHESVNTQCRISRCMKSLTSLPSMVQFELCF